MAGDGELGVERRRAERRAERSGAGASTREEAKMEWRFSSHPRARDNDSRGNRGGRYRGGGRAVGWRPVVTGRWSRAHLRGGRLAAV
jgi:hypothetical protein